MGSIHMGYRHLSLEDKYLYGVYGAFDRKRTIFGNYFNQITFGVECWVNRLFVGVNAYEPIGETTKSILNDQNEDMVPGVDAEVGYELIDGLIGYVGGYHFIGKNTDDNYGPKAKLTYDWFFSNSNKCGFEIGIRRDKQRDVIWYLSANIRVGLLFNEKRSLAGVSRHMVDLIRRDIDVISLTSDIKKVGEVEEDEDENPLR